MAKDNKKNRRYTKEEKEKLIARMLPLECISPSKLSFETGISKSTLATWKSQTTVSQTKGTNTSREKFLIVMETYTMSENDLAKYCRENSLYVEEVKQWRSSCIAANDGSKNNNKSFELEDQLKEEKKKAKELTYGQSFV